MMIIKSIARELAILISASIIGVLMVLGAIVLIKGPVIKEVEVEVEVLTVEYIETIEYIEVIQLVEVPIKVAEYELRLDAIQDEFAAEYAELNRKFEVEHYYNDIVEEFIEDYAEHYIDAKEYTNISTLGELIELMYTDETLTEQDLLFLTFLTQYIGATEMYEYVN